MPAPDGKLLAQLTKTNFSSKQIKLPTGWSQPGNQYPDAFAPSERVAPPNPPVSLFHEATQNKYHVDAAKDLSDKLGAYIDGIAEAICAGMRNWMQLAMINFAVINGPVGTVTPGAVFGPPLLPLIMAPGPKAKPMEARYTQAIAAAFGTAWQIWQAGLAGQLMYPAFAAVPSPVAPPMPNVPVPLVTFSSGGEAMLSPGSLKGLMTVNLADPLALHATELFDSLAQAFSTVFLTFKATTMVQNVLGTGPVPTFAPPFVPVGPVVCGTVIPVPGVFL